MNSYEYYINKYELLAKGIIDQLVYDYLIYQIGKINKNDIKYIDYIIAKNLIESDKNINIKYYNQFEKLCYTANIDPKYIKDSIKKISNYIKENNLTRRQLKNMLSTGTRKTYIRKNNVSVAQLDRAAAF